MTPPPRFSRPAGRRAAGRRARLLAEASRVRLAAPSPRLRRLRLPGPATLLLVLLAALAAAATLSPAGAQDAGEPPARPDSLTITVTPGLLAVDLGWSEVEGATDYWLRWRSVDNGERLNEGLRYTETQATLAVPHYGTWVVRVQACNAAGCGKPNNQRFTVAPRPVVPGLPSNLALAATPGELDLSATWDALDGATSYVLAWRRANGSSEPGNTATVTATSATITVSGYGRWVVKLVGCSDAGCGPAVEGSAGIAPAAPSNLTLSPTSGRLDLPVGWDAVDGATSYNVSWRQSGGQFEAANTATVTTNSATITVSGVGKWVVKLEACNDVGCGPAVTQPVGIAPGAPSNLAVTATPGELDLSAAWDALEGATTYKLSWRRAGGDFEADDALWVSTPGAAFTVDGFGEWVVRLNACNAAGCGDPAGRAVAIEPPNRAPVVNTDAAGYGGFAGLITVPRGQLVSKTYAGVFSDPDGDQLTYHISNLLGPFRLVEQLGLNPEGASDASAALSSLPLDDVMRVYFEADGDDDWGALVPPVPERPLISVELTATDPEGLSASVWSYFLIEWEPEPAPACDPVAPSSVTALGIEKGAVVWWTLPENDDETCEVTGFVVGATGDGPGVQGLGFEDVVTDPAARKHVMRGLEPGDYRFYVRVTYRTGADGEQAEETSDELRTDYSHGVPHACDIVLEVAPYTAEGHSATFIGGSWRTDFSKPSGCIWGPEIEFQWKRSQDDYYVRYGKFPNGFANRFIAGSLEPYVSYDFKIVAFNAAGERGESNVATTMIVSNDVSVTADANSPRNLRVRANNNKSIWVFWDAPESFGAGRSFSHWVVEWKTTDGTSRGSSTIATQSTQSRRLDGLVDGASYVIRVAARTTGTGGSQDAWSAPAPAVTAWFEPTQLWFSPGTTPTYSTTASRVWMFPESNKLTTAGVCRVHEGTTDHLNNCPLFTTVSLRIDADAEVSASITATITGLDENNDDEEDTDVVRGWDGVTGGPTSPRIAASGGNGKLFVEWSEIESPGNHFGALDAYVIEHRQGTSGSWTQTVVTDTTARSHTVSVTTGQTYEVRVRGRSVNSEDHDDDPNTPDQDVTRLGFASETLTVETNIGWWQPPRIPSDVEVEPGEDDRTLVVTWEHPKEDDRSKAHAYQVRHRVRGSGGEWTTSEVLYPRRTHRMCGGVDNVCVNPRTYEIEDLIGGRDYEIATRARNANGWGEWAHEWGSAIPNGIPPAFSTAAADGTELGILLDKQPNVSITPPTSAFTVKATSGNTTRTIAVSAVDIRGTVVSLTLASAVVVGETVTVSYTQPETNPLQDSAGNKVESFTDQPVDNTTS